MFMVHRRVYRPFLSLDGNEHPMELVVDTLRQLHDLEFIHLPCDDLAESLIKRNVLEQRTPCSYTKGRAYDDFVNELIRFNGGVMIF